MLHRFKFGQMVRNDGPKGHLKKSGTPTMGGIAFILGILAGGIYLIPRYKNVAAVLLFTVSYGIIGLLDDALKIKKKKSEGLKIRSEINIAIYCKSYFYNISLQNIWNGLCSVTAFYR